MPCYPLRLREELFSCILAVTQCLKYLPNRVPCMAIACLATPCLTLPHVAHVKLHKTCMFNAMGELGPCKHVREIHCRFLMAPCIDMCVTMKLQLSITIIANQKHIQREIQCYFPCHIPDNTSSVLQHDYCKRICYVIKFLLAWKSFYCRVPNF